MVVINMKNVTSKIDGLDEAIKLELYKKLSYEESGFGVKPVRKTLFNMENSTTYTGIIPHVINTLRKFNIEFKINDYRVKPESNASYKIQQGFLARDYQQNIIDNSSTRDVLQAATGAGLL